jgi:mannan polymerase II complex ANP1 subunit
MNRHNAAHNGYAARKRHDDDDEAFSGYPNRSADLESRSIWGMQDLVEDEADGIAAHRFEPRRHHHEKRNRMYRIFAAAATVILVFVFIFVPSARPHLFLGSGKSLQGAEYSDIETLRYYDLADSVGSAQGWEREERILLCTPLRDAEPHLHMFFQHLRNFTYPHHLIDLAFLVSDSKDKTEEMLSKMLEELQADANPKMPYGEISVIHKDFGQKVNQDVESRHGFAAQAGRRKLMAQARNWLLSAALRPYHSWVYWRDADVETCPFTILEDLMRHDKDVIVPSMFTLFPRSLRKFLLTILADVWRPLPDWLGGEQPYDLNSWQESETALALADTLDEDAVIVEGYAEYATWRPHLAYLRDPYGDPDVEMEIDGVGGVSILAKARVFRAGVHFPAFSFEKHAETEGFGKMAKRMQFSVVGLPHYTVWHLYEPSVDDIRHMEEMEHERIEREKAEKERIENTKKLKEEFGDASDIWEKDRAVIVEQQAKEEAKARVRNDKLKEKAMKDAVAASLAQNSEPPAAGWVGVNEKGENVIEFANPGTPGQPQAMDNAKAGDYSSGN